MEDEIQYLRNFLQGTGSRYIALLTIQEQELLSEVIAKAQQLKAQQQ
jgi:hypothetical protein